VQDRILNSEITVYDSNFLLLFPHLLPFCTSMFYKCLHMNWKVLHQSTLRDHYFHYITGGVYHTLEMMMITQQYNDSPWKVLFPWCTSLTASDRAIAFQSLPSLISHFFGSYKFYGTLQHRNMSINNSLTATSGNTQQIQMLCKK